MTRHALAAGAAGVLAMLVGCQSTQQHVTIKRNLRQEEWRDLAVELDGAPIYAFSPSWEPAYHGAVDLGVRPRTARRLLRSCAQLGVSLEDVNGLFETARTARQVVDGLEIALSEAHAVRREEAKLEVSGYVHHHPADSAEAQWARTCHRIERFPTFASPIAWEGVYDDMIRIGLTPARAGKSVWQAVRFGISSEEVSKLLVRRAADPQRFVAELRDRCHAREAQRAAQDAGGYDFMRGEKRGVKEAPKIGEITGKGAANTFEAAVTIDPAVLEVARIEARMLAQEPADTFAPLAAGIEELLGNAWAQIGVVGANEAEIRRAAERAANLGQLVRAFDGGVVGQAVAAEGGAVRVSAVRMATAQDADSLLKAIEASSRAQDEASADRNGPIESADYEAAGMNVAAGFLVTKTVAHGAGEYTDVGFLAARSGSFIVQATVVYGPATIGVARDAEQLRSFVEQVLAILPQ